MYPIASGTLRPPWFRDTIPELAPPLSKFYEVLGESITYISESPILFKPYIPSEIFDSLNPLEHYGVV